LVVAAAREALRLKIESLDAQKAGLAYESARYLNLMQIDNLWKDHMKKMDYVKEFASMKVYIGEKPINVYRQQGLELYQEFQSTLCRNNVFSFFSYEPGLPAK
jgi:preprotein translocase subunit SecA